MVRNRGYRTDERGRRDTPGIERNSRMNRDFKEISGFQ
jgi:hypothetical protein